MKKLLVKILFNLVLFVPWALTIYLMPMTSPEGRLFHGMIYGFCAGHVLAKMGKGLHDSWFPEEKPKTLGE